MNTKDLSESQCSADLPYWLDVRMRHNWRMYIRKKSRFQDGKRRDYGQVFGTFYRSALDAAEGDRKLWKKLINRVISGDPDNHYYRWFLGDRA